MSLRTRLLPLVVLLALLTSSGLARAAVTTSASTITVTGRGVVATIERSPFRMSFGTATGRTEVTETGAGTSTPSVLAPTLDPVAPGYEPARSGQLYAPLAFLVGTQTYEQYDGLVWGGNLMSGTRSGIQYSARAVTAVRRTGTGGGAGAGGGSGDGTGDGAGGRTGDGAGVVLTVSTDDPGRTLEVTVTPDGSGLMHVTVVPDPANGVALMSDAFASPAGEAFYGFGGRHNALNERGENLASFVEEENISRGGGSSSDPSAELFPNGPTAAYYPQAQFISSRGYGFLLDQTQLAWFRLDSDEAGAWSVAADADSLSYVVAPGGVDTALRSLTALTGRMPAPRSRWELGPMLDRLVKNVGETDADYEANLAADLKNIVRYHLPLTAYRVEGWGMRGTGNDGLALHTYVSFADQQKVIRRLNALHIHPLAYLRPWITPGSAPDLDGYAVRQANGQTYDTTTTTGSKIALVDFTNPAAVRWWDAQVDKTLNLGFDGFMSDFGEEVLSDMHFHDGATGLTMHNAYPVLYEKVTHAAVLGYEHRHHRQIFVFNRSGYSGTPGSAAYTSGNFPGDETTNWDHYAGLASLAPDMLNRAIGGAYGYATDIGGYYDYTTPATTKELFLRWAEWAALSPIFRLHGSGLHGTHTPWSYDMQTVRVYNALSRLHEAASPYILRLWREADRTGIPPTRPLWLQFPRDPGVSSIDEEWMLGPDVLVTPVVTEGATSLNAYVPSGCWRDPQTRVTVRGPATHRVAAPLTRLPFFFRCGTRPFRTG